jgi:hypothetical protein
MSQDIKQIARVGRWSSLLGGTFTFASAFALFYDFASNAGIKYFCWLMTASCYLTMTIAHKHAVKTCGTRTEAFYSDLAATIATIYACYEVAIYYLQLTYLRQTKDPIGMSLMKDEPSTPVFALDLLGYFLLSISTILVAFSIIEKEPRLLRFMLLFHGYSGMTCIVVPALPMMYQNRSEGEDDVIWQYVLLLWTCAQFTPICLLMSNYFHELQKK